MVENTKRNREWLQLHYVDGMSIRQIASKYKVHFTTVHKAVEVQRIKAKRAKKLSTAQGIAMV